MEQKITVPKGCKIESVEHDDNQIVIMFSEDKNKEQKIKSPLLFHDQVPPVFNESMHEKQKPTSTSVSLILFSYSIS